MDLESLPTIGDASPMSDAEKAVDTFSQTVTREMPPPLSIADLDAPAPKKTTPETAAARSASYELSFGGIGGAPAKLEPFSKTRQVGSQCMGVEIFNNPNLWDELAEKKTYNGLLRDAIFIVFLCISPASTSKKATRITSQICDQALDWWEKYGDGLGGNRHAELIENFSNIVEDVFAVMAETAKDDGPGESDGLGE